MTTKGITEIIREDLIGATISDIRIRVDPDDPDYPGIALASDIVVRVGSHTYHIVAEEAPVLKAERHRTPRPLTIDDYYREEME